MDFASGGAAQLTTHTSIKEVLIDFWIHTIRQLCSQFSEKTYRERSATYQRRVLDKQLSILIILMLKGRECKGFDSRFTL